MSQPAERLVDQAKTVASPPLVYDRLVQVINHPRSGSVDIARVIGEDQGLTSRLLRVVNSAFFSFPRPIGNITQAVTVVGTSQIRDLALATSVMSMFDGMPEGTVDLKGFWHHSLGCGVTARAIASLRGEDNVERFFVAGLLHDIGQLIILMHAGAQESRAIALARESGRELCECEVEVLGCDHTRVGERLLERWHFPGSFREAIAYHHSPLLAPCYPVEAAVVHVAEVTAEAFRWGQSGEPRVPRFDPGALDVIGLQAAQVPHLIEEAERRLEGALHFMGAAA